MKNILSCVDFSFLNINLIIIYLLQLQTESFCGLNVLKMQACDMMCSGKLIIVLI